RSADTEQTSGGRIHESQPALLTDEEAVRRSVHQTSIDLVGLPHRRLQNTQACRLGSLVRDVFKCQARRGACASGGSTGLQRTKEVQQILFLQFAQVEEVADDRVGFRAEAHMRADRRDQIRRTSVVKEEDALAQAPQRRAAELTRAGLALADA